MLIDQQRFDRLVTLASAAPADGTRWSEFLDSLQGVTGAHGSALFSPVLDSQHRLLNVAAGSAEHGIAEYAAQWADKDAWIVEAQRTHVAFQNAGDVCIGPEVLAPTRLRRTDFYCDFLRRHDIEDIISLKVCSDTDPTAPPTHLSLHGPRGGQGFGVEHKRLLKALWPHVQRAVQTHWALARAHSAAPMAEAVLDAIAHPAWLLRKDATIEHANAAAREAVGKASWAKTLGRKLHALGDLDATELQAALDESPQGGGHLRVAALAIDGRLRRAVLRVVAVGAHPGFATYWPYAHALLVLQMPAEPDASNAWMRKLARHHGLTPAECGVLQRLALRHTPQAIAEDLQVSVATVRTQMRALFDKTGRRRQSELVRLAAGG